MQDETICVCIELFILISMSEIRQKIVHTKFAIKIFSWLQGSLEIRTKNVAQCEFDFSISSLQMMMRLLM